MKKGLYE
jgi:hypothetical protein